MMPELPIFIPLLFIFTTLYTVWQFYRASNRQKVLLWVLIPWMVVQAAVALSGFYHATDSIFPRFALLVLPPLLAIAVVFATRRGKNFVDEFDLGSLTLLHTIRIPVEIVLLLLFTHGAIPEIMTFEGRNFDIFSGLTAPVIYYLSIKRKISRSVSFCWNIVCLLLLINIVAHAILSAPSPVQRFGLQQPNVAVLYFPVVWLPCCIVPIVLFAHLVAFRKLTRDRVSERGSVGRLN